MLLEKYQNIIVNFVLIKCSKTYELLPIGEEVITNKYICYSKIITESRLKYNNQMEDDYQLIRIILDNLY